MAEASPGAGGASIHTPSLRRRLTVAAIGVVAVLVVLLDAFVFLQLRGELEETLDQVLDARLQLAVELGTTLGPRELDERLTSTGVPATVRLPDGEVLRAEPASRRFEEGPPASVTLPLPLVERSAPLPDGSTVTVFASGAGVDATLDRVLLLEVVGSVVVLAVAVVVLRRTSRVLLRPIDEVVAVARRIASGRTGERLAADRTDTELGRMAEAFDEMLDALEGALAEARAAEERSRRFVTDAAHQLRTPVAGVRASVETALRTVDPARRERLLDNLAAEAARLGRLVASLLRLAELEGSGVAARAPTDVAALVRGEADRSMRLDPRVRVDLVDDLPGPRELLLEAESVQQALANLLDNARRHAASGVEVTLRERGDAVEVAVRDDGPGLPAEQGEEVFERFVSRDGRGGSGLGLPIARRVARAHGGDLVWADGAFRLRLPGSAARSG